MTQSSVHAPEVNQDGFGIFIITTTSQQLVAFQIFKLAVISHYMDLVARGFFQELSVSFAIFTAERRGCFVGLCMHLIRI